LSSSFLRLIKTTFFTYSA